MVQGCFKTYLSAAFLLFLCIGASAQRPGDYGFEEVPGVPSKRIYSLLIDQKGFIWIGGDLGVSRYDGKTFTSFYNKEQSSLAMGGLSQDKYGRTWCRNFNDQIFYIENGRLKLFKNYDQTLRLYAFVLVGNELVIRCNEGLLVHNLDNGTNRMALRYRSPDQVMGGSPIRYRSSVFFILFTKGVSRIYQYRHGRLTVLPTDVSGAYDYVVGVNDRYLVVKNRSGFSFTCFERQKDRLVQKQVFHLESNPEYALSSLIDGGMWIHTEGESISVGKEEQRISHLALTNYEKDSNGNLWASSRKYGLLLKKRRPGWQFQPTNNTLEYITAVSYWQHQIVAGTSNGQLLSFDTAGFQPEKGNVLQLPFFSVKGILPVQDHLYVYGPNGLIKMNRHFQVVSNMPLSLYMQEEACIMGNMIIFSSASGLSALPTSTIKDTPQIIRTHFKYHQDERMLRNATPYKRVRGVAYDSLQHLLYAGFSNGLYVFSADTIKTISFNGKPIYSYSIKAYKDKVYVSTLNEGVLVITPDHRVRPLKDASSLIRYPILRMKLFGTHLWVISSKNISLYDIGKESFIRSFATPSLQGMQVLDLLEANNNLYFSTSGGLYKIPLKEKASKPLPSNYLLSVKNINTGRDIGRGEAISYKNNSLQFNLAGLYYTNPKDVYFNYRIIGTEANDTNWRQGAPGQDKILLPHVAPGHYTFEAIAHTFDGLSALNKIRFPFTIKKPWWYQSWFLLTIFVMMAAISTLIMLNQKRIQKIRTEKLRYEKEANENELKALKSQMNPHFISNSLNSVQAMFMRGDKKAANEQLTNFAALSRLILSVSGKDLIPISTVVDILKKYLDLEKVRFRDDFDYDITVEDRIDEWFVKMPPLIVQPLAENSIKHGLLNKNGYKHLSINFKMSPEGQHLICTITDNGIGREKAAQLTASDILERHQSFSTDAIRKRLSLIYQMSRKHFDIRYEDLKDNEGNARGTSVELSIPIDITDSSGITKA